MERKTHEDYENDFISKVEEIAKNCPYTDRYYSRDGAEVRELTSNMSMAVNSFSIDEKQFAGKLARMSKAGNDFLCQIFLCYISICYENFKRKMFDPRNEASITKCADIARNFLSEDTVFEYGGMGKYIKTVAENFSLEHRTLQQTMCKVIFHYISLQKNNDTMKRISDYYGEDLPYGLPLI